MSPIERPLLIVCNLLLPNRADYLQMSLGRRNVCKHLSAALLRDCNVERLRLAPRAVVGRFGAEKLFGVVFAAPTRRAHVAGVWPW